jgi:flagellin
VSSVVNTTAEYAVKTPGTGVFAKVNENIMTGQSMVGGPVTNGVVFINGYASADITTIFNNSQATRANVVRAINLISDRTGVKAIDTGSDTKGISLVAPDGRNIEVRFEMSDASSPLVFGQRIGLRDGVQSSTISLESKIQAPVVLGASPTGDITRIGLVSGNFSKNESILNTRSREPVNASVAQVSSVKLTATAALNDKATVVINGTTFTSAAAAAGDKPQAVAEDLIAKINANNILGVYATKGKELGEILLTARTPGVSFTMTASASTGATMGVAATEVTANKTADTKNLGMDDLEINGIKIRPTTPDDDKFSKTLVSSSNPAASGIALAAAINASTSLTGVTAEANPAVSEGSNTFTGTPISGKQSLWVNGTKIDVNFVQNETGTERREKVVAAINDRIGQHGVTASDNGKGVTLKTDGRNLSVWFDSSQDELSAANFGLDKGGAVAQVSRVKIAGAGVSAGEKASVYINGVKVETAALVATSTAAQTATALALAISSEASLKNITAVVDPTDATSVLITSNVAGTSFDLRAPTVTSTSSQTLTLGTVTANSTGKTDVSAVDMSTAYLTNVLGSATAPLSAMDIKTVYSTVKLTSDAPVLPALPGADGLPPNMMNITGRPIQIRSGADGFGPESNFSALGFNEGSFGGRASQDMDPPRVGRLAFQVGSSANQVITIDLADFGKGGPITGQITADADLAEEARKVRINTREGATAVLNMLDASMDKINATRATMGAVMNRLDHVINNLTNVSMNMSASRSQIEDADYASASTELAKTQIMQQAATAVLAQANTSQQSVLKLLGG